MKENPPKKTPAKPQKGKAGVAVKHAGGRPPKFTGPTLMQIAINAYFTKCDEDKRPYTISGLAIALDMTTQALRDYQSKPEFLCVKKAKQCVERSVEERLFGPSATGSIFWLKNHANYKDQTETKHSGTLTLEQLISGE